MQTTLGEFTELAGILDVPVTIAGIFETRCQIRGQCGNTNPDAQRRMPAYVFPGDPADPRQPRPAAHVTSDRRR
jgi:hypothetical protein